MAYKLLAMHPILHLTMIVACATVYFVNKDEFFNVTLWPSPSAEPKPKGPTCPNQDLVEDSRNWLVAQMAVHVLACILYILYK